MNTKTKSYINLTLAMAISGSAVIANKMMVNTIPTFLATEIGVFLGLIILCVDTFLIRKDYCGMDLKTLCILIAQSACGIFLYRIFTFYGLKFTSAANSGLITSCSPAVVVILAHIFLKEKMNRKGLIGLALVMSGLFSINIYTYMTEGSGGSFRGNLLIMAAVVCEAMFSVISKAKCRKMTPHYRTTMLVLLAFIMLLPLAVKDTMSYNLMAMPGKTAGCLVYYGIAVSYLSYIFWFKGIESVKANEAAPFTSVVPVISIILAALILGEHINVVHIAGTVLVIAGIIISSVKKYKK